MQCVGIRSVGCGRGTSVPEPSHGETGTASAVSESEDRSGYPASPRPRSGSIPRAQEILIEPHASIFRPRTQVTERRARETACSDLERKPPPAGPLPGSSSPFGRPSLQSLTASAGSSAPGRGEGGSNRPASQSSGIRSLKLPGKPWTDMGFGRSRSRDSSSSLSQVRSHRFLISIHHPHRTVFPFREVFFI